MWMSPRAGEVEMEDGEMQTTYTLTFGRGGGFGGGGGGGGGGRGGSRTSVKLGSKLVDLQEYRSMKFVSFE